MDCPSTLNVAMQFQHLSQADFASVVSAAQTRASHYVTEPSGVVERSPASNDIAYKQAYQDVLNALQALSDQAVVELQALAWAGRGDSDGDLDVNLGYSRQRFDGTTRQYLYGMPLHVYLPAGLARTALALRP